MLTDIISVRSVRLETRGLVQNFSSYVPERYCMLEVVEAEVADWTGLAGRNYVLEPASPCADTSRRHGSYVLHHSDTLAELSFRVRVSLEQRVGERGPADPASFNTAWEGRKEVTTRRKGRIRV